ncbi:hypothetical protein J6590_102866, partial [Homalodisca vitripennis]
MQVPAICNHVRSDDCSIRIVLSHHNCLRGSDRVSLEPCLCPVFLCGLLVSRRDKQSRCPHDATSSCEGRCRKSDTLSVSCQRDVEVGLLTATADS